MANKMTVRQAFLKGWRAWKAGRFILKKGFYWEVEGKKPCGCACGMIAYGFGYMRSNSGEEVEEVLDFLKSKGMSRSEIRHISNMFEQPWGSEYYRKSTEERIQQVRELVFRSTLTEKFAKWLRTFVYWSTPKRA